MEDATLLIEMRFLECRCELRNPGCDGCPLKFSRQFVEADVQIPIREVTAMFASRVLFSLA